MNRRTLVSLAVPLALLSTSCSGSRGTPQPEGNPAATQSPSATVFRPAILPDPLAAGWQGQTVCERLHEDENQRILRCTFSPGIGHERHFHAPHFGYVIAGSVMKITDESGEREIELRSGTSWTSKGTAWHEVLNVGATTGIYLIVEPK